MDPQTMATQLSLQYMTALSETIQLNGTPQIVQPYAVWDWGGTSYPMGSVPWQQVAALDVVPNDPLQNTQNQGAAGSGFSDNYELFLNFLNPNPNQTDPKYQAMQQALTNANRQLYSDNQNSMIAFKNFLSNTSSTEKYTEWLQNEGESYQSTIAQDKQNVASARSAINTYLNSLSGPVKTALSRFQAGLIQVQDQGGQAETVAPWFTDHSPYDYTNLITGNSFGGDALKGSQRSFNVNQSTNQYSDSEVWGEGGLGGFLDWFGIEAGGSYKQVDTSSMTSSYSISFAFQDLGTIQVTPGPWFDGGMLGNYRNGPFSPGYSGFQSGADVYFLGTKGNVARMYTAMVVGYRPTITIDGGAEFASYFEQQIKGEGAVWIGPFAFEAQGGSDQTKGTVEVDGSTITAKGLGNWPYIVALVSNWTVAPQ